MLLSARLVCAVGDPGREPELRLRGRCFSASASRWEGERCGAGSGRQRLNTPEGELSAGLRLPCCWSAVHCV